MIHSRFSLKQSFSRIKVEKPMSQIVYPFRTHAKQTKKSDSRIDSIILIRSIGLQSRRHFLKRYFYSIVLYYVCPSIVTQIRCFQSRYTIQRGITFALFIACVRIYREFTMKFRKKKKKKIPIWNGKNSVYKRISRERL